MDNNECLLGTHNCEQHCVNTVGSFRCECDSGYLLTNSSDRVSCIGKALPTMLCAYNSHLTYYISHLLDINECANNNGSCQHNCSNTDGSFLCSCRNGYVLGTDQLSCIGKNITTHLNSSFFIVNFYWPHSIEPLLCMARILLNSASDENWSCQYSIHSKLLFHLQYLIMQRSESIAVLNSNHV